MQTATYCNGLYKFDIIDNHIIHLKIMFCSQNNKQKLLAQRLKELYLQYYEQNYIISLKHDYFVVQGKNVELIFTSGLFKSHP